MRVIYNKARGSRIKKGSRTVDLNGTLKKVDNFEGLNHWVKLSEDLLYWDKSKNKWIVMNEDTVDSAVTLNRNIKNVKQAIRHIKKHNEIPKGSRFVLKSNFEGYDVIIIK